MDQDRTKPDINRSRNAGFFGDLIRSIVNSFVKLMIIFMLGTTGGAVVCLYYGFPLIFSVGGGIAIFAIATAAFLTN